MRRIFKIKDWIKSKKQFCFCTGHYTVVRTIDGCAFSLRNPVLTPLRMGEIEGFNSDNIHVKIKIGSLFHDMEINCIEKPWFTNS